jgi:hypothetical protein
MATEKEMHELIGRAVVDPEFRKKLATDTENAAKEAGFSLTEKQLEEFKGIEGKGLASVLEENLPKSVGRLIL